MSNDRPFDSAAADLPVDPRELRADEAIREAVVALCPVPREIGERVLARLTDARRAAARQPSPTAAPSDVAPAVPVADVTSAALAEPATPVWAGSRVLWALALTLLVMLSVG